jgi:hypothetical protein
VIHWLDKVTFYANPTENDVRILRNFSKSTPDFTPFSPKLQLKTISQQNKR